LAETGGSIVCANRGWRIWARLLSGSDLARKVYEAMELTRRAKPKKSRVKNRVDRQRRARPSQSLEEIVVGLLPSEPKCTAILHQNMGSDPAASLLIFASISGCENKWRDIKFIEVIYQRRVPHDLVCVACGEVRQVLIFGTVRTTTDCVASWAGATGPRSAAPSADTSTATLSLLR
jgi:hypothetical protein